MKSNKKYRNEYGEFMKWNREDLGYLKIQLIRKIIGLVGMIIMFIIGLMKNMSSLVIVGALIGAFIVYQLIKTIITINEIENRKR